MVPHEQEIVATSMQDAHNQATKLAKQAGNAEWRGNVACVEYIEDVIEDFEI